VSARDPDRDKIGATLVRRFGAQGVADHMPDVEAAIWWFAYLNEHGEATNLHAVLSASPHKSSRSERLNHLTDRAREMFDHLTEVHG
jgi:hypothetical protein